MQNQRRDQQHVIGMERNCFANRELQCALVKGDVAVGKQDPRRRSALCTAGQSVRLAQPPCRQFADVEDFKLVAAGGSTRLGGDRVHPQAGAIRRSVVDGNNLQPHARRGKQRAQARFDGGLFVAGRNHYRQVGALLRWNRGQLVEIRPAQVRQARHPAKCRNSLPQPGCGQSPAEERKHVPR